MDISKNNINVKELLDILKDNCDENIRKDAVKIASTLNNNKIYALVILDVEQIDEMGSCRSDFAALLSWDEIRRRNIWKRSKRGNGILLGKIRTKTLWDSNPFNDHETSDFIVLKDETANFVFGK